MEDKIKIFKDGVEIECDVCFSFDCEELGKSYVAFTDHSTDKDGNEALYVKSYDVFSDNPVYEDVSTPEEWNIIEEVLENIKNGVI